METTPRNPLLTVDAIIEIDGGIILIKRKNPPPGWAIPGGFVDYGESLEDAACREAKEETSLDIKLIRQFHTYSKREETQGTTRIHYFHRHCIRYACSGGRCKGDRDIYERFAPKRPRIRSPSDP